MDNEIVNIKKVVTKSFEQISEENDFRDEVISTTAHSLRTSLSAMKWVLQMFLDKDFGNLSIEQENMLKKTFENTNHMISMVNDMIKVNKSLDTIENEEEVQIDMTKLIDSLIFDFNAESFKHDIQMTFIKPEFDCLIRSYPEKIKVMFSNLLENSIRYSSVNDKIIISIKDYGDSFVFSIKDSGIGIPLEEQSHMFEKFYRAKNAIEKESAGSGIGLYTVKRTADSIGATVDFVSNDFGTIFNITIKKA